MKPSKPKGESKTVWVEIDRRDGSLIGGWMHDTKADAEFWARLSTITTIRRATLTLDPPTRRKK